MDPGIRVHRPGLAGPGRNLLADARIYAYGEERASRPIARAILRSRDAGTLRTTLDTAFRKFGADAAIKFDVQQ